VEPAREYEQQAPGGSPPGPWWQSPWLASLAAIVALLIGGGVGYAIGNGESGSGTTTHTATTTTTVTQPPKTVTNTVTSTTIKETASPANQANEERRREAEADLRKVEKENQELKRKLEESKP
jgi:hypothetical protein